MKNTNVIRQGSLFLSCKITGIDNTLNISDICVHRSQMISKEDYDFIAAFDTSDAKARENKLKENPHQAAKTFLNLLGHVSKDQTIQYLLTMIDDMLQV